MSTIYLSCMVKKNLFFLHTQKAVVCFSPLLNIKELPGDTGLLSACEVPEDRHMPINETGKLFFCKR